MNIKSCKGCAHLQAQYIRGPVCKIGHSNFRTDPLTGGEMFTIGFITKVRAEGGVCGPERKLYKPCLGERIKIWWRNM